MNKQDELSLPEIFAGILNEYFPYIGKKDMRNKAIGELCDLFDGQLVKVLKHRLDRPELRKKIDSILSQAIMVNDRCEEMTKTDQLLALIPDIEEAKKQEAVASMGGSAITSRTAGEAGWICS